MSIQKISAITFFVRDMSQSVDFYEACGFDIIYGGRDAEFTTLRTNDAFINLVDNPDFRSSGWGRVIIRVDSADEQYQHMTSAGIVPDFPPKNAAWGERYFHVCDPDGHELSFAEQL